MNFRERIFDLKKQPLLFENGDYQVIREAVKGLPDKERRIVERHFWGVESLTEIASSMGLDWEEAKIILDRGFKKLRWSCLSDPRFSRYCSDFPKPNIVPIQRSQRKGGNNEPPLAG